MLVCLAQCISPQRIFTQKLDCIRQSISLPLSMSLRYIAICRRAERVLYMKLSNKNVYYMIEKCTQTSLVPASLKRINFIYLQRTQVPINTHIHEKQSNQNENCVYYRITTHNNDCNTYNTEILPFIYIYTKLSLTKTFKIPQLSTTI